jgi:alkanesulfonate monooxygenase SsuD/methylene tetrahydromethanopterin reductase-like flavin-dependent oxidoreductase (luciferase family)
MYHGMVVMADVKFGVMLPNGPQRDMIDYLNGLEEHYDSAWIADHLLPPPFVPKSDDLLECLTTIGYLSGMYAKLDFGTIVLCNSFRNPALVAKMAATLDAWTGGRFILGIGAGWYGEEYRQYGYDFPSSAIRIRQLEEGVQIIKRLWTEDSVTFKGRHFRVEDAYCNPKPDPPIPVMIGARGERLSLKVVARNADWWNIQFIDVDAYEHKLGVLERHCSAIGRDPGEIAKTLLQAVAIAETDEEADKLARSLPWDYVLAGSPETVRWKVREFVDAGVEYFILLFWPFPNREGSKLFSEEVIPEFK